MHCDFRQRGFDPAGRPGVLSLLCLIACIAGSSPGVLLADDASDREYRLKAAFVYNFLKFVDGGRFTPAQENKQGGSDPNDVLVIGILGLPPSQAAFEELKGRQVAGRSVVVRWFRGFEELAENEENEEAPEFHPDPDRIRKCHVLFICPSERPFLQRILPHLQESGILTIGDVPAFLESGGVINLFIEDEKVRFEINLAAVGRARLIIRSSLLRLAVRTIEHDQLETSQDKENPGETVRP